MRFSCKIFIEKNTVIPNDYRRYLLSLIKETIKNSSNVGADFYKKFYENNNNIQKPFTFSAYFPIKKEESESKFDGDFFNFYFSTNNYEFLMRVYNGLLAINKSKENDFELFGSKIKDIKNFYPIPEKRFDKNEVIFKTLSPFLVRSTENGDYYLYPDNVRIQTKDPSKNLSQYKYWKNSNTFIDDFKKSLSKLVQNELSSENNEKLLEDINVELLDAVVVPILHGSANKEHEYSMTFPGIKGKLKIKTNPEVLKLFYDIGIGARRSEGFGMLEVVE